ncbi:hypothetical protein [Thiomicrospira sp.]|uniref:hypothetical protein n=1 Tax=Thiomicrospira sp. TaxID=935 RepID=UPI002F95DF9A
MTEKLTLDTLNKLDASHRNELTMQLDADNRIVYVSSNWEEIAEQGQARQSLAEAKVLNQPFSQYVADQATRLYYENCLTLCRLKKKTLTRAYRCDSPTHKRFMEMQLTPLENGWVEMKHFLVRSEPFKFAVNLHDVSHQQPNQSYQFTRCSLCNRLKDQASDDWKTPESLGELGKQPLNVIHTICPQCQAESLQFR